MSEEVEQDSAQETVQLTEEDKTHLIGYGMLFEQLMQSERFKMFFATNFDLIKNVDEETKTAHFYIVEVPPEMVMARMKQRAMEAAKAAPMVELATPEDVAALRNKG